MKLLVLRMRYGAGVPTARMAKVSLHAAPTSARRTTRDTFLADPERGLAIVADGMGGHAAGEVASKITVETIAKA